MDAPIEMFIACLTRCQALRREPAGSPDTEEGERRLTETLRLAGRFEDATVDYLKARVYFMRAGYPSKRYDVALKLMTKRAAAAQRLCRMLEVTCRQSGVLGRIRRWLTLG